MKKNIVSISILNTIYNGDSVLKKDNQLKMSHLRVINGGLTIDGTVTTIALLNLDSISSRM